MTVKRIPIAEFRELGYLHELNRQFLHPHGLALEVCVEKDGTETLGGVWDYREDPEGMLYGQLEPDKMKRIEHLQEERARSRYRLVGSWVQEKDAAELPLNERERGN